MWYGALVFLSLLANMISSLIRRLGTETGLSGEKGECVANPRALDCW